jgi:hypoxanthine phosphoribosyltransferase
VPPVDSLSFLAQQLSARDDLADVTFAIRPKPQPALTALGFFDARTEDRLKRMSAQVQSAIHRLQYVTYADAEDACDRLGQVLREAVGSHLLEQAHAVGVPRGGLIVLGMLSYVLNLRHAQLEGMPPSDRPLLVVDDIALTGNRLHRFLQKHPNHEVVIATLFSHPELREAMVREEPQVKAFVSAHDLHDYARERDDYADWKAKWHARPGGKRYWTGQPDHVCFPWSEPDIGVWNPETEAIETAPRIVPPALCLKNRFATRGDLSDSAVQMQPKAAGPIKPPSTVFFGSVGDSTIVANPEADVCIALQDSGEAIWHSLIRQGSVEAIVQELLGTYDTEQGALTAHVARFIDQLMDNHLLVRGPS